MGHADLNSFYSHTYDHLSAVLDHINELSSAYECSAWSDRDCCDYIDTVYNEIVSILNNAAEAYVPEHRIFSNFGGMRSSARLTLPPLTPINCGKPQVSRVTAQSTVHASLAGRGIVLDFAINKQWKVNLTLMTYTMPYF